jgi:hypothetical protein
LKSSGYLLRSLYRKHDEKDDKSSSPKKQWPDKQNKCNSVEETDQISKEEAKRLLLLLGLKAKRRFNQLSLKEKEEIHECQQYLEKILQEKELKRPKKKKKKAKKEIHVVEKSDQTSCGPSLDQEKSAPIEDPERMTMKALIQRRFV